MLRTCRKYLHWVQRSVFQGELSAAQYRALLAELNSVIDRDQDSIMAYATRSPDMVNTACLGIALGNSSDIL